MKSQNCDMPTMTSNGDEYGEDDFDGDGEYGCDCDEDGFMDGLLDEWMFAWLNGSMNGCTAPARMTVAANATFSFQKCLQRTKSVHADPRACTIKQPGGPRHPLRRLDRSRNFLITLPQSLVFPNFFNDLFPLFALGFVTFAPHDTFVVPGGGVWLDAVFPNLAINIYRHLAVSLWATFLEPFFVEFLRRVLSWKWHGFLLYRRPRWAKLGHHLIRHRLCDGADRRAPLHWVVLWICRPWWRLSLIHI